MKTLTTLTVLMALVALMMSSCSNSGQNPQTITSKLIRGKVISADKQIIPVRLLHSELSIYRYGDTVSVSKSQLDWNYIINEKLIDSTSIVVVLQK